MAEPREELSLEPRPTRARGLARLTPGRRPARAGRRRRARPGARGRGALLPDSWRLQRSIVRASYAGNAASASWAAHGRYLAREGAQRDGQTGLGFDAERDDVDLPATLRGWQKAGDVRLWKFVVSPEHAARLDLRAHTRQLVEQMQEDLGTRLEWAAIDHHNTGHAHAHLLVRGRDCLGRPLEIASRYLTGGLRARSQELATGVLGFRSEREHLAARGQAVERARLTDIDRVLLRRADHRGLVTWEGPPPPTRRGEVTRLQEMRRLQFLDGLGLAEKVDGRTWRLLPRLERALRQAQLADEIPQRRARRRSDPGLPLVATAGGAGSPAQGLAQGTGLADGRRGASSLLLEGADGRFLRLPQPSATERARGAGRAGVGEVMTMSGGVLESGGRQIVQTHVRTELESVSTGGPNGAPEPDAPPVLSRLGGGSDRAVPVLPPVEGLAYRGRLVGYARGSDGQRYAVVDTGRELSAFRTEGPLLAPGRDVRATAYQTDDGRHRRLLWRLGPGEREQGRERA